MSRVSRTVGSRRRVRALVAVVAAVAVSIAGAALSALPASAAAGFRINLRVLLVTNGDSQTQAFAAEMDRLGIPYTSVDLTSTSRSTITQAFLEDDTTNTARFESVILPNQAGGGLFASETAALTAYEMTFGIRQINCYDWPSVSMGLPSGGAGAGPADGAQASVTAAGLAGPFSYLKGPFSFDVGSWGAVSVGPAGSYTSLVDATLNGTTGTVMGVYTSGVQEQLVSLVDFNQNMQWFNELAPGMLSWVTRGVYLGYQRNYFNVHVDDVFLPDSRWSIGGKCTPGDTCADSTITTADIRMTDTDVSRLTTWQTANRLRLTMVFNGSGAQQAGGAADPLTTSLLGVKDQFPWINHTWQHWYLGCIQIAPLVTDPAGSTWHCATSQTEQPRMDTDITPDAMSGGIDWAAAGAIQNQVQTNIDWATTNGLPNFDPSELVTGEHSGLASSPQMSTDNPFLGPELQTLGVKVTASDASRETKTRNLVTDGSTPVNTVPRHPMNIFYNAGTFQDEVAEYNWIYTSAANGGSDICVKNPATTTCITPLDASSDTAATASFDNYIKPIEITNAMRDVLTNDPRPFYAHQSNLAEDGILYPVLDGVVAAYGAGFNTTTTPLVQNSMTAEYQALAQLDAWNGTKSTVDGYLDSDGVHLPSTSVAVPLTVPTGSNGTGLSPYAGALSGWLGGGSSATVPATGFVLAPTVPPAPTIGTATAGNTSATVSWTTPASTGGSPLSGYTVRAYTNGTLTTITASAAATATSVVVPGLTPGTPYTFDVAAINAIGTGAYSAQSSPAVIPTTLPGPPTAVTAVPGSTTATVSWTAPAADGFTPITGYLVRGYVNGATTPSVTATVTTNATSTTVTGLSNGDQWSFDVAAVNANGTGPYSAQSTAVTPKGTLTPVPSNVQGQAGNTSATITWSPPSSTSGITGYRVRAYVGAGTTAARSTTVPATSLSASLTGLTNGTGYTFDVAAVTSANIGPTSTRSASVTPALTAQCNGAPTITTVAPGQGTLTVSWSPPSDNSGSTVSGYRVRAYAGAAGTTVARSVTVTGTGTTATVTGLTNGTAYSIEVNVQYAGSNGAVSARSTTVTPIATVPSAPVIGAASSGALGGLLTATARWSAPAANGGSAITGYVVTATSTTTGATLSSAALAASARSYQMTLPAGTYTFSVVAQNARGTSAASAQSNVVTAQ